jgi:hypothetical protein
VIFLVTGFQYMASSMVFNFGYEFRRNWFRNFYFVIFSLGYTFIHFFITLKPGHLSCLWRVNCSNDNVLFAVSPPVYRPIQNAFGTTVMPKSFRGGLFGLMIANTVAIVAWDYLVVNGSRRYYANKKLEARDKKVAIESGMETYSKELKVAHDSQGSSTSAEVEVRLQ